MTEGLASVDFGRWSTDPAGFARVLGGSFERYGFAVVAGHRLPQAGHFEDTSKLSTFLFGVVRNMWLRRLARRRREMPEEAGREDPPDPDASAQDLMMEDERTTALGAALHRLGNPCRELLLLYYYEELTLKEIGEVMGFTESGICQIHAKSILKLKTKIRSYMSYSI